MSPLAQYRQLFALTGPVYVFIAFLARLPLAMSQIGALLLVSTATGSYTAGGTTAGALAVANAIASPAAGALSDRIGQRPVLLVQAVVGTIGLLALVGLAGATAAGGPWWPLAVVAALAGVFLPQVGTMARVRWRPISRHAGTSTRTEGRLVDAAFSYEGSADEASFVLGPALVGLVTALIDPAAALVTAAVLLGGFGTWFAAHPTVTLVGRVSLAGTAPARLLTPALLTVAGIQLSIGMIFGSVQTGTSVLATQAGEPGLTGLFHGLLGVGSVLAGLAVVMVPETFAHERRLRLFTITLVLLALPLLAVDALPSLALALLVLGLAIAPSMITTFTIAERITPARRLGAAMTLLAAMTGLGYAVGAALAGGLADAGGHRPAFAVTLAATALSALLALSGVRRLRAAQGSTGPGQGSRSIGRCAMPSSR